MNQQKMHNLKERISEEMTVDYSSALEKNFDLAKQFIGITKAGKVDIFVKNNPKQSLVLNFLSDSYIIDFKLLIFMS